MGMMWLKDRFYRGLIHRVIIIGLWQELLLWNDSFSPLPVAFLMVMEWRVLSRQQNELWQCRS